MCARLATPAIEPARQAGRKSDLWIARPSKGRDLLTSVLMSALLVQTVAVFVAAFGSGAFTHTPVSNEQVARTKPPSGAATTCQQEPGAPQPGKARTIAL
jgi:hypothetical protein